MIILVMGLPGSGKTTLTSALAPRINATVLNGDAVRADLSNDLSFGLADRLEQARRIGAVARLLDAQGHTVVCDFVCPTAETRMAFGRYDHLVLVDRIEEGRFADTNAMFERPDHADVVVPAGMEPTAEADLVITTLGLHDWSAPTTLLLGRYQPWHEGHRALLDAAQADQPMIGVRSTYGTSPKDPLMFEDVRDRILADADHVMVVRLPNITRIVYGRDVGYSIERLHLGAEVEAVSATAKRAELGLVPPAEMRP